MDIDYQIQFLKNYFKTNKIIKTSTKKTMDHDEVERIRKLIKRNRKQGTVKINRNFSVEFKGAEVIIKDSE